MTLRQRVWVGPEATSFEVPCEACLARRGELQEGWLFRAAATSVLIEGTLRREADVAFTGCPCGHRVVVRRVGRVRRGRHAI